MPVITRVIRSRIKKHNPREGTETKLSNGLVKVNTLLRNIIPARGRKQRCNFLNELLSHIKKHNPREGTETIREHGVDKERNELRNIIPARGRKLNFDEHN